jgi:hypothetical protein
MVVAPAMTAFAGFKEFPAAGRNHYFWVHDLI